MRAKLEAGGQAKGGDPWRGRKGGGGDSPRPWPPSLAAGLLPPPEGSGLGGRTVSKRGSLTSFCFFVLQRHAQAHEPAQERASFCCGRCRRNSEQLMFHQIRSRLGGPAGQKAQALPLTSGSPAERC